MRAKIVVGLGFGDEGKGITVDYLCSKQTDSIVVRFSGGQQAGHTVMIDGKKHTHSNYGSGTLRGCPTYFTEHCTMYPAHAYREKKALQEKGVNPYILYHPLTKVTTPYDIAWNKMNTENRAHGTCGMGVGATMKRNESPYTLYAIDLLNKEVAEQKINSIRDYYEKQIIKGDFTNGQKWDFNHNGAKDVEDFWLGCENIQVRDYKFILRYTQIVFEGSQGVMLDMTHGIFPNVTYANTTSKNAVEVCNKLDIPYDIFYITRAYQTRHGNGWMSNNKPLTLKNNEEEINVFNSYQGEFRVGEIDYNLLNLAIKYDSLYSGNLRNKNLVVTCLDQLDIEFDYKALPKFDRIYNSFSPDSSSFVEITEEEFIKDSL